MAKELHWQEIATKGINGLFPTATNMYGYTGNTLGGIQKWPIAGGAVTYILGVGGVNPLPTGQTVFGQYAVDGSHISFLGRKGSTSQYWFNRTNLSGAALEEKLAEGHPTSGTPTLGISAEAAMDSEYFYWLTNEGGGSSWIARMNLTSKAVEPEWLSIPPGTTAFGIDATHIYWPTKEGIARALKSGEEVELHWQTWPTTSHWKEATERQKKYWIDSNFIWVETSWEEKPRVVRVPLTGKYVALIPEVEPRDAFGASAIASDANYLYWVTPTESGKSYVGRWSMAEVEEAGEEEVTESEKEREEKEQKEKEEKEEQEQKEKEEREQEEKEAKEKEEAEEKEREEKEQEEKEQEEKEKEEREKEEEEEGPSVCGLTVKWFAENWEEHVTVSYWLFVDPATHSGYRLTIIPLKENKWRFQLELVTAGSPTILGTHVATTEEGWHLVELGTSTTNVVVSLDEATIISVADTTYSKGFLGMEGVTDLGGFAYGDVDFSYCGELLDDLKRAELPFADSRWKILPWAENTGEAFSETYGWIARGDIHEPESPTTSGIYFTPREFERHEGEGEKGGGTRVLGGRPPVSLHLNISVATPGGFTQRWGQDDPNPIYAPKDLAFSTTMPGGFERLNCTLQRDPGRSYPDLEELSTVTVYGPGGSGVAWQGRLEKLPDTAGFQSQVSPEAVGWQADLEDDKSVREIYVDQELARWIGTSAQRKIDYLTKYGYDVEDGSLGLADPNSLPAIITQLTGSWSRQRVSEMWYDAKGIPLSQILYGWLLQAAEKIGDDTTADEQWFWNVFLSDDGVASSFDISGNLRIFSIGSDRETGGLLATTAGRTWAGIHLVYGKNAGTEGVNYPLFWPMLAVYGRGLPSSLLVGGNPSTFTPSGVLASDVVAHAISRWAPKLRMNITKSTFVIPQLAFLDPTTVAEVIKQATRFELQDWAVWEGPIFYMNPRGTRGKAWRARVGPAQLQEAGPQISRLWNGVVVQYTDVSGQTQMVGPPGFAGALPGATDGNLLDTDPTNPLNQEGTHLRKWALLSMGTSTAEGAKAVGRIFLQEQRRLEQSGQATLVGYVEDANGTYWPSWSVRAGDTIQFLDASDPSPRRIVSTSYSDSSKSNAIQLDQPPEGMQALLERLSVSIIGTGLT